MENNYRIPSHVSIIMDGNGRWAKERGKERVYGHFEGVESVRAVTEKAAQMGVKYLSLFAFSEENWGRPEQEVMTLMELMVKCMANELGTFLKNGIRFKVLGNRARLSDKLNAVIDEVEEKTADGSTMTLIIMLSYSGKWDVMQAVRRVAEEVAANPETAESFRNMSQEDFEKYLVTYPVPDPDLVIRTSGECRISNYFLWQAAYSELYFTETLWPDFRAYDFEKAVADYSKRDRRYGKVK